MFAQIIYENGEVSVAEYQSEAEATSAVTEQHNRAKNGDKNGPQEAQASRIVKVLKYDTHPGDYGTHGGLSVDEVKTSINQLLEGAEAVDVQQLAQSISILNHPMVAPASPHDSRFKMESTGELSLELS